MKTKEEVIKEAWGDLYSLGVGIDENGWLRGDYLENKTKDILKTKDCIEVKRRAMHDLGFYDSSIEIFRPKSLKSIENNNGWIRINSEEDLPKNGNYWVIYNDDTISDCVKENELFEDDEYWLKNITHYQPINKPQPPLY